MGDIGIGLNVLGRKGTNLADRKSVCDFERIRFDPSFRFDPAGSRFPATLADSRHFVHCLLFSVPIRKHFATKHEKQQSPESHENSAR